MGKSTLARRYAHAHPMTLALEIDGLRAMIGGWLEEGNRSGIAARMLAVAAARTHLEAGFDVVVPQLLTRREFVDLLRRTTEDAGAEFVELTLMGERGSVLEHAHARAVAEGGFDAAALAAKQGHTLGDAYDAFAAALAERPDAVVIDTESLDTAYDQLVRMLRAG